MMLFYFASQLLLQHVSISFLWVCGYVEAWIAFVIKTSWPIVFKNADVNLAHVQFCFVIELGVAAFCLKERSNQHNK